MPIIISTEATSTSTIVRPDCRSRFDVRFTGGS
jgi:hypothetical protein